MSSTKILVTGATGNVGRGVVDELQQAGADVRALTRRPEQANLPAGVEVVRGDLADPKTLIPALAGVARLYLFPHPETAQEVVDLAKAAGVAQIVVLSSALADQEDPEDETGNRPVELAAQRSGLAWTLVRPGEFAANWLDYAPDIRATREVRRPFGSAVSRPTHEADIAAVAATVLLADPASHAGQIYTFGGPEALTVAEQVHILGTAIGEPVRFVELTPEQARQAWLDPAEGITHEVVDWLLDLYGSAANGPEQVGASDAVERVTGRKPRTFLEWATDHAAAFR
ncbi:NAD(P)H-binding protein [Natronosporangium hydrolyticum]|uniref:NAD(P)H-binding protein n=1 Tax=Natronosporangium hydrolyticum TaxID=2811111 RepID=A0A895YAG7_9ACTN|nr:NAD(P)H-binding protein [Natronosporangium hydrolyticum]QSB14371.1 NAD(P)H-binding protein [Natronosporangium hydrolyticum]